MKILLVFPPQWIPYRPYLSLPSLTAYLKEHGLDVIQKDFNAEAYDLMLSEKYLLGLSERLNSKFKAIDSLEALDNGVMQKYYNDLFIAKSSISSVASEVENAKIILRNNGGFYDPERIFDARNTLEKAFAIISIAHFPSQFSLSSFEIPTFSATLKDILDISVDRDHNPFIEVYASHLLPTVMEQDSPEIIGISITGYSQFVPALTLARMIKALKPNTHIVIGGNVVSLLADSIKKHHELFDLFIDSAIILEGERPLLSLVEHIRDGRPLHDVPNLIYRDAQGIQSNAGTTPEDINMLPTPCFDGLPLTLYLSPEPVFPLRASRGCYWAKCAFCSHSFEFEDCYHGRDTGKIFEDMQNLCDKYGAKHFAFCDEAISPKLLNRLSDKIIASGIKVTCTTNARMERQLTPELCSKLFEAGFKMLYLGLESGSDRVLGLMNKGIEIDNSLEVCRNVNHAGIWSHLYVMFGFPGETREDAQETIQFLISNKEVIRSFYADNFSLERGMEVQRTPEKFGVTINEQQTMDFGLTFKYSVASGLTYSEARDLSGEVMENVSKYFRGHEILRRVTHYYLPLYLAYYEKTDPSLTSILIDSKSLTHTMEKRLNRKSRLNLTKEIRLEQINYDLLAINIQFTDGAGKRVFPRRTTVIFNPRTGKTTSLSKQASEIIGMCDGKANIKEIARILARKYDAPIDRIENDVILFLESMIKNGYISNDA